MTVEQIQNELNITYKPREYDEITLSINSTEQFFQDFTFKHYQKQDIKYYLLPGTGTGDPNTTLYHTLVSPPSTVLGDNGSVILPLLLDDDILTLSFGYVNGTENVMQINNDRWTT